MIAEDDEKDPDPDEEANLAQALEEAEEESVQYDSDEWERWYVDHPENRPELSDDSSI